MRDKYSNVKNATYIRNTCSCSSSRASVADPVFEMRSDPDPVFKIWPDPEPVFKTCSDPDPDPSRFKIHLKLQSL